MAALASIPAGDLLTLLSQGNLGMVAGRTCHRFLFSLSRLWRWILSTLLRSFLFSALFVPCLSQTSEGGGSQSEGLNCPFRGFLAFQKGLRNLV